MKETEHENLGIFNIFRIWFFGMDISTLQKLFVWEGNQRLSAASALRDAFFTTRVFKPL
jgi:hypothetical protein